MTLEEVVGGGPCPQETAEKALALLQSFDPVGVGSRTSSECLLLQARAANVATPLLVDPGDRAASTSSARSRPRSSRASWACPSSSVQQAIEWIKKLDPKPGRRYDSSRTVYVEPDVAVVKLGDDYVVVFNDDGLPAPARCPRSTAGCSSPATARSMARGRAT